MYVTVLKRKKKRNERDSEVKIRAERNSDRPMRG